MAFEHENTAYGSYGEFDASPTTAWTAEDWAAYDAEVAAEIEAQEAEREAFYAEAEADLIMAYHDYPDFW